jgi:hypothetical protein
MPFSLLLSATGALANVIRKANEQKLQKKERERK